ncbi:Aste57867_12092 [Aphanomyces stellatus]|uniref:Aste57867_12092 protein n=1 Tax=Aphanomyces stellatus TaxID=120398 RepID=A0A485KWN8_9STRA|nr:hypothetical protein As57867_012047 [Aphanomyces stellatus]VFT88947.1 Aste57867_12092 [Aphanomyces stellatus]
MATAVEQARAIFDRVDTTKDGVIDRTELGKLLEALGEEATPQNIVSALFQMDAGGDGTISFDEFVAFYKSNYLPRHPTKLLTSRRGVVAIGQSKSASYTLPPPTFCFGKALQRDKENAGQVLRQHGDACDDILSRTRDPSKQPRGATKLKSASAVHLGTSSAGRPHTSSGPSSSLHPKSTEARGVAPVGAAGVAFVLTQLKAQLQARGMEAFQALAAHTSSASLSFSDLKALVHDRLQLDATEKDLRAVFSLFDMNGDNTIDASEWATALLTPLTGRRLDAVQRTFRALDTKQVGRVELGQLRRRFDGTTLAEVRSGLHTVDEVRAAFLAGILAAGGGTADGSITQAQFEAYYMHVSSATVDDDVFLGLVRGAWQVDMPPLLPPPTPTTATASLAIKPKENFLRVRAPWLTTDSAGSLLYNGSNPPPDDIDDNSLAPLGGPNAHKELNAGLKGILARMRTQLQAMGVTAWMALDRAAAAHPSLSLHAFKQLMKDDAGMALSDKDWRVLFEWFAGSHTTLNLQPLLAYLHVPLTPARLGLVRRAFRALDDVPKWGGRVPLRALVSRFDAARHPAVQSGRSSEIEVTDALQAALNTPDDVVTAAQFESYYGYVSQGIDDDDDALFERHVTHVWKARSVDDDDDASDETASIVASTYMPPSSAATTTQEKKHPLVMYQESVRHLAQTNASTIKSVKSGPKSSGPTKPGTRMDDRRSVATRTNRRPTTSQSTSSKPPTKATKGDTKPGWRFR